VTLNRMGFRTGAGNNWTVQRVYSARNYHKLPPYDGAEAKRKLTMAETAARLGTAATFVRRLIVQGVLPAEQVVPCAPWAIDPDDLTRPEVVEALVARRRGGRKRPRTVRIGSQLPLISTGSLRDAE
jgi:hypothetical protein